MNRCSRSCSARLLETSTESNSESIEFCRTPQGKNNVGSPNTTDERSTGGLALSAPAVPPDSPQSVNPTRILTVLGFGGTANLQSPPLRILLRLRGGGYQMFFSSMEAQQRHRWLSRLLSLYSKATSLASSVDPILLANQWQICSFRKLTQGMQR